MFKGETQRLEIVVETFSIYFIFSHFTTDHENHYIQNRLQKGPDEKAQIAPSFLLFSSIRNNDLLLK